MSVRVYEFYFLALTMQIACHKPKFAGKHKKKMYICTVKADAAEMLPLDCNKDQALPLSIHSARSAKRLVASQASPTLPKDPNTYPHSMKVSIITATYNSAATLKDTLESVLAQTHKDIEYIVIDGASTDGTLAILESYAPKFGSRMQYYSEPDKGIYDAMNKGLARATGDVVGILNSDDFYSSPHSLERLMKELEASEADAVYADIHYADDANLAHCTRYYSSSLFRPSFMRLGFMPAHPTFYCKRECFERYGFFDTSYRIAADFELLLRFIYVHHIRTTYLKADLVTMRTGGASNASLNNRMRIMQDHQQALRSYGYAAPFALLSLRYLYKMWEIFISRFHKATPLPAYIQATHNG